MKQCSKCQKELPLEEYNFMKTKGRYMAECKSCFRSRVKQLRAKYKEYDKQYAKEKWLEKKNDPEYQKRHREYQREYKRKRRQDPQFKLKENLRTYFYRALTDKSNSVFDYLGCSLKEFKVYLSSLFDEHMSWDNYGTYWEVDHIKPIETFDFTLEEQIAECWSYKNLRPLTINENRKRKWTEI